MTLRIAGFPSLYIQGPGALSELSSVLDSVAANGMLLAIVDPFVAPLFKELDVSCGLQLLEFSGECTQREIDRLTSLIKCSGNNFGAILGAGGGKALDTAKAVAYHLELPVVIAPTVASSDAPTSRIVAVYDDHHRIVSVPRLRRNPDAVIVDTSIIRKAPVRFFAAGIGDALTKRYEVSESVSFGNKNFFGAHATKLAQLLAEQCDAVLRRDAVDALEAVRDGVDDPAIERVVEATVLYSGLAFEGGGLSIAHGLLRGLTARPESHLMLHGELVAYGLLVQRVLAEADHREIAELRSFLIRLGLPVSLEEIGFKDISDIEINRIASLTFEADYVASQRESRGLSVQKLVDAIYAVEKL